MAWIELHQNLLKHPKLIRLAAQLSCDRQSALWSLVSLWLWAIDYADDGDLKKFGPAEIATAADWNGDAATFVKALQDCRWMDRTRLHDWMDYAGRLVEKRAANRDRMREKRAGNVQRTTIARAGATVPYRTVPNQPEEPPVVPQGGQAGEVCAEFEEARKAWPGVKRGYGPEFANFKKKFGKRAAEILPLLLPAIRACKAHAEKKARQEQRPAIYPHFQTWVNQERWTAEYPGQAGTAASADGRARAWAHYQEHGYFPANTPSAWMSP